jgi:hypothetical protein
VAVGSRFACELVSAGERRRRAGDVGWLPIPSGRFSCIRHGCSSFLSTHGFFVQVILCLFFASQSAGTAREKNVWTDRRQICWTAADESRGDPYHLSGHISHYLWSGTYLIDC